MLTRTMEEMTVMEEARALTFKISSLLEVWHKVLQTRARATMPSRPNLEAVKALPRACETSNSTK